MTPTGRDCPCGSMAYADGLCQGCYERARLAAASAAELQAKARAWRRERGLDTPEAMRAEATRLAGIVGKAGG